LWGGRREKNGKVPRKKKGDKETGGQGKCSPACEAKRGKKMHRNQTSVGQTFGPDKQNSQQRAPKACRRAQSNGCSPQKTLSN